MEEVLKETGRQVPSLVVLVVVVWMFLKFMGKISDSFTSEMSKIHQDHIEARSATRKCLDDNTNALKELTVVVEKMEMARLPHQTS